MSNKLQTIINLKLGKKVSSLVKYYEEKGAYWAYTDEGLKLFTKDGVLLLSVKAQTLTDWLEVEEESKEKDTEE